VTTIVWSILFIYSLGLERRHFMQTHCVCIGRSNRDPVTHSVACAIDCCCSTFVEKPEFSQVTLKVGNVVLWHGYKCVMEEFSRSHSDVMIHTPSGQRVVAVSSLTKVTSFLSTGKPSNTPPTEEKQTS